MLADIGFVPLLEELAPRLPSVERYVVLTDAARMPASTARRGAVAYEDWIAETDGDLAWAEVDENAAYGLCCTPGTTGDPEGVRYSHRLTVLHTMMELHAEVFGSAARDRIGLVSPMFHANARVMPYAAATAGAALVLPGQRLDPASLHALARRGARDRLGRRADRLDDPAAAPGSDRWAAHDRQAHLERRLGGAADAHPGLLRPARHARPAPVGHDRDEPGRHLRRGEARGRGPRRGAPAGPRREAGLRAFHRGLQDHRRRGARAAMGRQDPRAPEGGGSQGGAGLLPHGGRRSAGRRGVLRHRRRGDHRSASCGARSPGGGCRTMWRSSKRSRTPRRARWRRRCSGPCSAIVFRPGRGRIEPRTGGCGAKGSARQFCRGERLPCATRGAGPEPNALVVHATLHTTRLAKCSRAPGAAGTGQLLRTTAGRRKSGWL